MRRHLSTRQRRQIFEAREGLCHICSCPVHAGDAWDLDHVLPLALGGADEPDNLAPAHTKCHREKTRQDVHRIRKADRQRDRHMGFKAKSRRPIGNPYLKRKFSGAVVRRETR